MLERQVDAVSTDIGCEYHRKNTYDCSDANTKAHDTMKPTQKILNANQGATKISVSATVNTRVELPFITFEKVTVAVL